MLGRLGDDPPSGRPGSDPVFRRSKSPEPTEPTVVKEGGKGRPTPSRKEAEAAARVRARAAMDKKAAKQLLRQRRAADNAKMREGLKTGDERYLPPRDKGPVRRFARDFIDSRISAAEFLLPLLIIIMLTQSTAPAFSNGLWSATILLVLVDTTLMVFRLKRQVRRRFPDESQKVTGYAILRALQLRWLRLPKPRVKIGEKLPERY